MVNTKKKPVLSLVSNKKKTIIRNDAKRHGNNAFSLTPKSKIKKNRNNQNKKSHKKLLDIDIDTNPKSKQIEKFDMYGGNEKYTSESGKIMHTVYKSNMWNIFIELRSYFKTKSPHYFKKNFSAAWEQLNSMGLMGYFSDERKMILKNLYVQQKVIYFINYVYHRQRIIRKLIAKIEEKLTLRARLIFNTIVTSDDLLTSKNFVSRLLETRTDLKGGFLNTNGEHEMDGGFKSKSKTSQKDYVSFIKAFEDEDEHADFYVSPKFQETQNQEGGAATKDLATIEHPSFYTRSVAIVGPSHHDFAGFSKDKKWYQTLESVFKKPITWSVSLYFKFKRFKYAKGKYIRRELDYLYKKIAKYQYAIRKEIEPLLKGQRTLHILYNQASKMNSPTAYAIFSNEFYSSQETRARSLGSSALKKLKKSQKYAGIYNAVKECWERVKSDYTEILAMYKNPIDGFWIQDKFGRVISRFHKDDKSVFGEAFTEIIRGQGWFLDSEKSRNFRSQIVDNILGQLYLRVAKKGFPLEIPQPNPTYFELRVIAQERLCYSRTLVQAYIWDILSKTQGFSIDVDNMISDPKNKSIVIQTNEYVSADTSLVDKMLKIDQTLKIYDYTSSNKQLNYVGFENTTEGLNGYMACTSLFGIYDVISDDQGTLKLGIPKHPLLKKNEQEIYEKFKSKLSEKMGKTSVTPNVKTGGAPTLTGPLKVDTSKISSVNKIKLQRFSTVQDNEKHKMGWFDIWKNHFNENYQVFSKLVMMNNHIQESDKESIVKEEKDLTKENRAQDVYYLYYRDEINKILVNAFTCCGMIDILYRTFITHMEKKIELTSDDELSSFKFSDKLDFICEYSQKMFSYPFIADKNKEMDISDTSFKLKIYITKKIVEFLFTIYDIEKPIDDLSLVIGNSSKSKNQNTKSIIDIMLDFQEKAPNVFPYDFKQSIENIKPIINGIINTNIISGHVLDNKSPGLIQGQEEKQPVTGQENHPTQQIMLDDFGKPLLNQPQALTSYSNNMLELIDTPRTAFQLPEKIIEGKKKYIDTISFNHFLNVFYNPDDNSKFTLSEKVITEKNKLDLYYKYINPCKEFIKKNNIKNLTVINLINVVDKLPGKFNLNPYQSDDELKSNEKINIDLYNTLNPDNSFDFSGMAYNFFINYEADSRWIDIQSQLLNHYLYSCQIEKIIDKLLEICRKENDTLLDDIIINIYEKKILANKPSNLINNINNYLNNLINRKSKDSKKDVKYEREKIINLFKVGTNNYKLGKERGFKYLIDLLILTKHIPIIEGFKNTLQYNNIYSEPTLTKNSMRFGKLRNDITINDINWFSDKRSPISKQYGGSKDIHKTKKKILIKSSSKRNKKSSLNNNTKSKKLKNKKVTHNNQFIGGGIINPNEQIYHYGDDLKYYPDSIVTLHSKIAGIGKEKIGILNDFSFKFDTYGTYTGTGNSLNITSVPKIIYPTTMLGTSSEQSKYSDEKNDTYINHRYFIKLKQETTRIGTLNGFFYSPKINNGEDFISNIRDFINTNLENFKNKVVEFRNKNNESSSNESSSSANEQENDDEDAKILKACNLLIKIIDTKISESNENGNLILFNFIIFEMFVTNTHPTKLELKHIISLLNQFILPFENQSQVSPDDISFINREIKHYLEKIINNIDNAYLRFKVEILKDSKKYDNQSLNNNGVTTTATASLLDDFEKGEKFYLDDIVLKTQYKITPEIEKKLRRIILLKNNINNYIQYLSDSDDVNTNRVVFNEIRTFDILLFEIKESKANEDQYYDNLFQSEDIKIINNINNINDEFSDIKNDQKDDLEYNIQNSKYKYFIYRISNLQYLLNPAVFKSLFINDSLNITNILGYDVDTIINYENIDYKKQIICPFQKNDIKMIFPFETIHKDNIEEKKITDDKVLFNNIFNVNLGTAQFVDRNTDIDRNNVGYIDFIKRNVRKFLINYLTILKHQLVSIKFTYLSYNKRIQELYETKEVNKKRVFKKNDFYEKFNKTFNQQEEKWGKFFDKNMRFYNHIIREWNIGSYENLDLSKKDNVNNMFTTIISNLLNFPQFDNNILNKILTNSAQKTNIDIDFLHEEFKNIKMGYPYYFQIAKQLKTYHEKMVDVTRFISDNLKTLQFDT
jgi:hypothetical protein